MVRCLLSKNTHFCYIPRNTVSLCLILKNQPQKNYKISNFQTTYHNQTAQISKYKFAVFGYPLNCSDVKWHTWPHIYIFSSITEAACITSDHIYTNNGSQNPPTLITGVHNKMPFDATAKSCVSEPQCSGFTTFMVLIFKPLCQPLVTRSEKSGWDRRALEFTSRTVLLLCRSSVAQSSPCIKWGWLLSWFMKLYSLSIM